MLKVLNNERSGKNFEKSMRLVETNLKVHFNRKEKLEPQIYRLLNRICKEYEGDKGRKRFICLDSADSSGLSSELSQEEVFPLSTIQFEGIEFPAPKNVDKMLRIEYGDYEKPSKSGGSHGYPCFSKYEKDFIALVGGRR